MTRSKRMQPIVRMAEARERDAARRLGECRRAVEQEERRLAELLAWRDEYARRFRQSGGGGLRGASLREYQRFLARLNQAIAEQRKRVELSHQACQEGVRHWYETRSRAKALGKVVERYRREERYKHARQEQRECDEHAARKRNNER